MDESLKNQEEELDTPPFEYSERELIIDQIFENKTNKYKSFPEEYSNFKIKYFKRVSAKKVIFDRVDFSHSYFEDCYFRDCIFRNCNFTGCRILNSNLQGSSFPFSVFDYSTFTHSVVDDDILINNQPQYENLKLKFARTLRLNYASLGDTEAVNKAIQLEIKATGIHLYKSAFSSEKYYRDKYGGTKRLLMLWYFIKFKALDIVWGNGEKLRKIGFTVCYIWLAITLIDFFHYKNSLYLGDLWDSLLIGLPIFLGILKPQNYSEIYLSGIMIIRLIIFGLFISIIIKKYNRR